MTPEQRLDRLERVAKLFVKAGLRARKQSREQDEKINILIHSQMEAAEHISRLEETVNRLGAKHAETEEIVNRLGAKHAETEEIVNRLAVGQAKTDEALRAFINSLRKGRNGKS